MTEEKELPKALKLLRKRKHAEAVRDNSMIILTHSNSKNQNQPTVQKERKEEGGTRRRTASPQYDEGSTDHGIRRGAGEEPVCWPQTGSQGTSGWR